MERSALHLQKQIKKQHNSQIDSTTSQFNPEQHINFIKKATLNQFIPFVHQRDSIGRLIKKQQSIQNQYQIQNKEKNKSFTSVKRSISLQPFQTQGIQSSLNVFFKQNCVYKKRSPEKIKFKIHKKPSLQEFMVKPNSGIKVNLEEKILQQPIQHNDIKLKKSQSLQLKRFDQISNINHVPSQKKYSFALSIKPTSSSTVRKLSKVSLTAKHQKAVKNDNKIYNLQKLKNMKGIDLQLKNVKGKISECQQLQRYREMKKLGMSLFDDINEGHNLFLKKLQDSKKLAYKIRQDLQS